MTRSSPDKLLRDFKILVRGVVSRVFAGSSDLAHFKPAGAAKDMLKGVGILGPASALAFNLYASAEEQVAIARYLVTLSREITVRHLNDFINHERAIVPKVLALNGKAGWDSTIATLGHAPPTNGGWDAAPHGISVPVATTHFYKCKLCNKVEPSTCKEFQYHDLDLKHKCFHCTRSTEVKVWCCSCGDRWYLCPIHRKASGTRSDSTREHVQAKWQASSSTSLKRKAESSTSNFGALLEEDLKRERKRARNKLAETITLGYLASSSQGPVKLGPILSRRFGRL